MPDTFAGLQYLTRNDCRLIIDRCDQKTFPAGEVLIQHGKATKFLYVIIRGKVEIQGQQGLIASVAEGEVCGEMAFLEEGLPSATAVAEEDVEAYAIAWDALRDLFEMFPHLASRFYRSVAVNLSRRLRQQLKSKPASAALSASSNPGSR